jgi:hypothetical protein
MGTATRGSTRSRPSSNSRPPRPGRLDPVVGQARRLMVIPLGAALSASDRVRKAVRPYQSPASARREVSRQLRRFERRGDSTGRDAVGQLRRRRAQAERLLGRAPARER